MVRQAVRKEKSGASIGLIRSRIADLMLRFSLFQDNVDRLIVSMRKPAWVQANIASFRKGRLNRDESLYLERLMSTRSSG